MAQALIHITLALYRASCPVYLVSTSRKNRFLKFGILIFRWFSLYFIPNQSPKGESMATTPYNPKYIKIFDILIIISKKKKMWGGIEIRRRDF
jgi:hypothetical protein